MNILKSYRLIRTKKVKYPIPEIPDDSEKKSGTDWVLPKNFGSGRVSGTRQTLVRSRNILTYFDASGTPGPRLLNDIPKHLFLGGGIL